jgi:CheY-like chemotaxis protein
MQPYKILIADDEVNIVKIMEFELKKNGYEVMTANDGAEAFALVLEDRPDLILSDIMMPKMDGYELCKKVKEIPEMRGIPFIFLTAKTGLENRIQGYMLGAAKYITKPCNRQELLKAIDMRLKLSEQAKKLFAQKAKKFSGDLSIISVFSLLDMFFIGGWDGYVEMATPDGHKGMIEIKNTMVSAWNMDGSDDEAALGNLLSWTQGTFTAEHV